MEQEKSVVETVSANLLKDIFSAAGLEDKVEEEVKNVLPTPPQENVVEVTTPPVITNTETTEVETKVSSDYSKRLKNLIKDGVIDNFAINYEDQEVFIEDIEDLTEEGYQEIIKGWKTAKKEEVDSKYISIEGLDEQTKKLIEIKKAGGDISEILRENVQAIDTLTQLKENIDDEQVQINIVAHSYQQQGIKPAVIQAQIKALIDEGILESEANNILDSHLKVHSEAIETKRQFELQRVEKEKEDLKNLKKTLSSKYKELNLPDNLQKVLVENATKFDENKISNTDKLYFEASKDPERYAELNFFLNNPEEFKKYISSAQTTKTKIDTIKPLFTVNINKTNKPRTTANTVNELVEDILKTNNQK